MPTDTALLNDSLGRSQSSIRMGFDSITGQMNLTRSTGSFRINTDSVTGVDAVIANSIHTYFANVFDSVLGTDVLGRYLVLSYSIPQVAQALDSTTRLLVLYRALVDSGVTVLDLVTYITSLAPDPEAVRMVIELIRIGMAIKTYDV